MKVLYISHYSSLYGANKTLLELVKNMKNQYNVYPIVITPDKGEFNGLLDSLDIENYGIKFYWWVDHKHNTILKKSIKWIRYKIFNLLVVLKINRIIINKNIDLIHTNSSVIDIGSKLAKLMNKPHIWHIREFGLEDYNLIYYKGLTRAARYIELNSSKVICISNSIKNKYINLFNNKEKLSLIYNGVDLEQYYVDTIEKKYNEINIIFTGLISEQKNQLELIKAMNIIVNTMFIKDIKAYFLGDGDYEYLNTLKKYVFDNNLNQYIFFEGKVKDVKKYMKKSTVGVISSVKEAFGRVTIEYMLSGLYVIASDTGANKELIEHGVNGSIYKLGDIDDLVSKILEVYKNNEILKNRATKGQYNAIKNFTSDINARNIFNLYRNLL